MLGSQVVRGAVHAPSELNQRSEKGYVILGQSSDTYLTESLVYLTAFNKKNNIDLLQNPSYIVCVYA